MNFRRPKPNRWNVCSAFSVRFAVQAASHASITGLCLLISAISLWSQEAASRHRGTAAAESAFVTWNASLEQAADGVLASAAQAGSVEDSGLNSSRADVTVRHDDAWRRSSSAKTVPSRMTFLQPVIDPILREVGIPEELAAVVLVESGGDPMALSPKGARGIWQLMPDTARRYGLTVDASEDDRLDIEKSTLAAARYLRDLHSEFGSWPLALAAYNTGGQNLQRAIDRSRSNDFNVLSSLRLLPFETRQYVPAVLSAVTRLKSPPAAPQGAMPWEQSAVTVFAIAVSSNRSDAKDLMNGPSAE